MCFKKSVSIVPVAQPDPVIRKEANASITKNSKTSLTSDGFKENIKTSPLGIEENPKTQKKTLLGE